MKKQRVSKSANQKFVFVPNRGLAAHSPILGALRKKYSTRNKGRKVTPSVRQTMLNARRPKKSAKKRRSGRSGIGVKARKHGNPRRQKTSLD